MYIASRQVDLQLTCLDGLVEILEKHRKYYYNFHVINFEVLMIQIQAWQVDFHPGKLDWRLLLQSDKLREFLSYTLFVSGTFDLFYIL